LVFICFLLLLNFGPQHPATHGVLRVIGILHGEIILSINIEIGLLHRGTEKLIELGYSAALIIPYLARLDYVSTFTQELLFIQLMELLFTYYISSVASLWRIVLVEFYRNLNHCLNITTHAIDIGLFTTMVWQFEEREKLIIFIEGLTGTRFHSALLLLGRLRYSVSLFWIESFVYWFINFVISLFLVNNILTNNRLWRTRLYEIGIIEKDICLLYGISGLLSRSAKLGIDARFIGYEFYHNLSYSLY